MDTIRLISFPGVLNLPNFAAEANGCFARRGIAAETSFTGSSQEQRAGLADGTYDIAHAAIDNAIAMVDVAGEDAVIVIGLDHGFNKFVVRPEITGYADLRGRIFGVDAPDTAFALVGYEMLRQQGLQTGDYRVEPVGATRFRLEALQSGTIDAALLNLPFNILAERAGLVILADPAEVIGAYQSTGGFVRRVWAEANRDLLQRYLAAYIEGLRWVLDPANRAAATALLSERMSLDGDVAGRCVAQAVDPRTGFFIDARLSRPGLQTVLALRAGFNAARTGTGTAAMPPVDRYVDESYYERALAFL